MPPLPKRKHSKGRRDRRRAHDALDARELVTCTNCGERHQAHHMCPSCGPYAGREVVAIQKD